jgi:putative aldouronate transport system permease protein
VIQDRSIGSKVFSAVNGFILFLYALICIVPFIHIIAGSLTTTTELLQKSFVLFPSEFSLDAYRFILSTNTLLRSLGVTILVTVAGTILNVFFTALLAYPLSRKDFDGRKPMMLAVVFTMLFNGGMIPTFLLVKYLGLIDTLWALMLPGLISAFILIILRSFFQQMPEGLEESAKIDGCNDMSILFRIVLPLSMPAIATISLFYAVGHWNMFMDAVLYINDYKLWPIQVLLRQVVLVTTTGLGDVGGMDDEYIVPPAQTVKMATIVLATVPILIVYPFLQKHFTKGALLGSVKG